MRTSFGSNPPRATVSFLAFGPMTSSTLRCFHTAQKSHQTKRLNNGMTFCSGTTSTASLLSASSAFGSFTVTSRRFQHSRPTMTEIQQACKTLDCRVDCESKQLKKQYLELVKKFHPDKKGGSEEKMKTISTAFTCIKSLSAAERSAYQANQSGRSYSSARQPERPTASYGGGGAARGTPGGSGSYRYDGEQAQGAAWGGGKKPSARAAYDWQRMYEEQRKTQDFQYSDYSKGRANQSRATHRGFNADHADMRLHRMWRRVADTPAMTFFKRFVLLYFGVTTLFVILYRRRQDHEEQEGWHMSESLHRRERLEELYKMREDVLEKVGNNPYNSRMSAEKEKERRVMEWASLKQKEMAELQRAGFGNFHPSLGMLHRKPEYPEGVVFFEPRAPDAVYSALGTTPEDREERRRLLNAPMDYRLGSQAEQRQQRKAMLEQEQLMRQQSGVTGLTAAQQLQLASDQSNMSPRNRELLAKRQREEEMYHSGAQPRAGQMSNQALPPLSSRPQDGKFAETAGGGTIRGRGDNSAYFPKNASEQLAEIQNRTREGPGGTVLHDTPPGFSQGPPPGVRAAQQSPTGGAYPEISPDILSIRPSGMFGRPGPDDKLPPPVSGSAQARGAM